MGCHVPLFPDTSSFWIRHQERGLIRQVWKQTLVHWLFFLWTPAMAQGGKLRIQYQCRQQVPLCRAPSVTGQTTPCIQRSPQIQRVCCHKKGRKPLSRWSLGKTGWESMGSIRTVLRRLEVPKPMERRREVHIYWTPVMNLVLFFLSWINYEKKVKNNRD